MQHILTASEVERALEDVVLNREFSLANGPSAKGGRKQLGYIPGRKTFTIKETTSPDFECGTTDLAATVYSER